MAEQIHDPRDEKPEDEPRKEHPEGAGSEEEGATAPFEPDEDSALGDTDQHSDA